MQAQFCTFDIHRFTSTFQIFIQIFIQIFDWITKLQKWFTNLCLKFRQSPNFLAFFPANSSYPGILGDIYSGAFTCAAFNWQCSPAVTELETIVLDNVARLINLPEVYHSTGEGGGVIQGTASEAIVTVVVAARDRYIARSKEAWAAEGLSEDDIEDKVCTLRGKLVALGSDQAHSSTKKAAIIAGVRCQTVETAAGEYSMTGEGLAKKIQELESKGLVPFYLTATLGTHGVPENSLPLQSTARNANENRTQEQPPPVPPTTSPQSPHSSQPTTPPAPPSPKSGPT